MSQAGPANSEWQRIWVMLREHEWTSLAIVPSHAGIDVVSIAESLTRTGRLHGERPVTTVNAVGVQLSNVNHLIESANGLGAHGQLVLVPVDPIEANPSAIAIVRAASAALLVVRVGESLLASAQATIDTVGRERFLGTILVDESGTSPRVSTGSSILA